MTKIFLCTLALSVFLVACGEKGVPGSQDAPPVGGQDRLPEVAQTMPAKIVKMGEQTILLLSLETQTPSLYTVPADSRVIDQAELAPGDIVRVGHEGPIAESYPAQISAAVYIELVEPGSDLLGLYESIFARLMEQEPALQADIDFIALDVTQAENLSAGDRQALCYLLWQQSGIEVRESTREQLLAEGLIESDGNRQRMPRGILLRLQTEECSADRFAFNAEKWRSPLGAYFFSNSQAELVQGKWSYTIGDVMIS